MPKYALKFISGKYQGGEFSVPDEGELIIGRAADLDVVLVEDMVSRKHAKLVGSGDTLIVIDLGSTNGTFVNGEKVRRAALKKYDRVLVGTSILRVIDANDMSPAGSSDREFLRSMMKNLANRAPENASMSGELSEVPLPDLLQLFSTNKKTGALIVGKSPDEGTIYLKDGNLQLVVIANLPALPPMKALCRMLSWESGPFIFDVTANLDTIPQSFQTSTESLLMEVMRQNDEMNRLLPKLPKGDAVLRLRSPLIAKLSELAAPELDTLQCVMNLSRLQDVLDQSIHTDYEVLTHIEKLIKNAYLNS